MLCKSFPFPFISISLYGHYGMMADKYQNYKKREQIMLIGKCHVGIPSK